MSRILVVAAHPDDEAIGCGGTIARHHQAGDEVGLVFFTDGVGSRKGLHSGATQVRNEAAKQAADILGAELVAAYDFPDNRLDTVALLDIVRPLEQVIERMRPDTIYTHFSGDLNVDHRCVSQAVMTAARPQPRNVVQRIYAFEIASSTGWAGTGAHANFVPNCFVDITSQWELKRAALESYSAEMRAHPHARSIPSLESLAIWRGSISGLRMAEAFILEREIVGADR